MMTDIYPQYHYQYQLDIGKKESISNLEKKKNLLFSMKNPQGRHYQCIWGRQMKSAKTITKRKKKVS